MARLQGTGAQWAVTTRSPSPSSATDAATTAGVARATARAVAVGASPRQLTPSGPSSIPSPAHLSSGPTPPASHPPGFANTAPSPAPASAVSPGPSPAPRPAKPCSVTSLLRGGMPSAPGEVRGKKREYEEEEDPPPPPRPRPRRPPPRRRPPLSHGRAPWSRGGGRVAGVAWAVSVGQAVAERAGQAEPLVLRPLNGEADDLLGWGPSSAPPGRVSE